MSSMLVCMTN